MSVKNYKVESNFEWYISVACHKDKMRVGTSWISSSATLFHTRTSLTQHRVPWVSVDITSAQYCITDNSIIFRSKVSFGLLDWIRLATTHVLHGILAVLHMSMCLRVAFNSLYKLLNPKYIVQVWGLIGVRFHWIGMIQVINCMECLTIPIR